MLLSFDFFPSLKEALKGLTKALQIVLKVFLETQTKKINRSSRYHPKSSSRTESQDKPLKVYSLLRSKEQESFFDEF